MKSRFRLWVALHRISLLVEDRLVFFFGRQRWSDGDLVSFPIATYDRIDILTERTIPSLLAQTHRNVEVLIALDGTSYEMASRLQKLDDPRIRTLRLRKRTKYPSAPEARWMVAGWKPRTRAARSAKGNWVYWISDDDVLLPQAVERLLEEARATNAESVSGSYQAGICNPVTHSPSEGFENFGQPISGPPAWLCRSYLGKMRWNRYSWLKQWNRPSDYDLFERMVRLKAKFSDIDDVVAVQPEVEGTNFVGRRGAIQAARNFQPPQEDG